MSNYNNLKTTIDANIKQNGNQEITGPILNSVLNQMVNILGTGYQFAGIATLDPATEPGTPDAKVFYIANGKGTYTNFGGIKVTEDEVVVLYWDSAWHKVSTGIASQAKLSELEGKVDINPGKNLYNPEQVTAGKYIISKGMFKDNESYSVSDYIPVSPGDYYLSGMEGSTVRHIGSASAYFNYYDSSKNLVSTVTGADMLKTIPDGIAFIRVSVLNSLTDVQIERSTSRTAYEEYNPIGGYPSTYQLPDYVVTDEKLSERLYDLEEKNELILGESTYSEQINEGAYGDHILSIPIIAGWKLIDMGGFEGTLMFSPEKPFKPSNRVNLKKSDLPYEFKEDMLTARPNAEINTTLVFKKNFDTLQEKVEGAEAETKKIPALELKVTSLEDRIAGSKIPMLTMSGNMSDGTIFSLEKNSVKTYKTLAFSAKVASFGSLLLGHGMPIEKLYSSSWIEIDNTNVKVTTYYTEAQKKEATYAHGLTITNNIQVRMNVEIGNLSLRIVSNGEIYEKTDIGWDGCNGTIFAQSNGSVLDDATLSWTTKKYDAKIWMYGDSYFGLTNTARWPYHLVNDKYTDILINGFAGANASNAINDFKNEIQRGTPWYVLWCMGMNGSDSSTAVNQTWLNVYNELKSICEASGITLVLSTIPTVRGGSVNDTDISSFRIHKFKNEIIRNSGLRYVDVDKAVGASETTGEWYEGMLSSDGVHPTQKGAITIYQQILAEFPEIATAENY